MKIIFMLLLVTLSTTVLSADEKPRRPADTVVIDTLALPPENTLPAGKSLNDFKRDSTVSKRRDKDDHVTEYRLKGKLYKIVVKPAKGSTYTLIDEKGDGKFVAAGTETPTISVPMWVLLSW